jgi:outer membrane protein OmpA-like peptidoglycan-associated protein
MNISKTIGTLAVGCLFLAGSAYSDMKSKKSQTPEQVLYQLNLHFDTGKANIQGQNDADIQKVADELKNYPHATAIVEGYADSTGSTASNQELSRQRGESLKQHLVSRFGVDGNRVKVVGYGETKPVAANADNATAAGKQRNRAVLVTVNRYMTSHQDQQKQAQ